MEIRVEPAGRDSRRLVVHGELDMAYRGHFLAAVAEAMAAEPAMIEVDLTNVSFLDAAGVGALVDARNAVAAAGRQLRVRGAVDLVLEVLEICGVVEFLGVKADSGGNSDDEWAGGR
jgi:anti-anti-sigma factor